MDLEWDSAKAEANLRKHGVRFADASDVLEDERALTMSELVGDEERFVSLGRDAVGRLLVVVYTHRDPKFRIISVRKATAKERAEYEEEL
jgi:uncharacterized DUF497 family protein